MNRICRAFDDIGNINMNYAGIPQFNWQMLLSEPCTNSRPEIPELFCEMDSANIASVIESQETNYANEKQLINGYSIVAEDIISKMTEKFGYYQGQRLGEWTTEYGSRATRRKVFAGKCTNFFKNISVAEFYLEAIPSLQEGDELLITGETTGAYELTAHDLHNEVGLPVSSVQQGHLFALKTAKTIHRGDRLFLWEDVSHPYTSVQEQ